MSLSVTPAIYATSAAETELSVVSMNPPNSSRHQECFPIPGIILAYWHAYGVADRQLRINKRADYARKTRPGLKEELTDRRRVRGRTRLSIELTANGSVSMATGLWNRPPMIFRETAISVALERFDRPSHLRATKRK